MNTTNSRTRLSIELQDPSRHSGVKNVVRITSQSESPSIPTW